MLAPAVISTSKLSAAIRSIEGPWLMSNEDTPAIRVASDANGLGYRRVVVQSNLGTNSKKAELIIGPDAGQLKIYERRVREEAAGT